MKAAYYTVQNLATLFDTTIEPVKLPVALVKGETAEGLVRYTFRQKGTMIPLVAFWDASKHPVNENEIRRTTINLPLEGLTDPVWIDLVTGAIYRVPEHMIVRDNRKAGMILEDVPYYDAPVVVTDRKLVIE